MNLPLTIKPCIGRNGTGTKSFGTSITTVCYAEGEVKIITDAAGKEVVSMKQLYVDGTQAIKETDNVIFEGRETEIRSIGYFYRDGIVDIKVVFL
jgi:hypothetical protein